MGRALRWMVGALVAAGVVVAGIAFAGAGPDAERSYDPRFDPRRCPPAENDNVVVLVFVDERGEDLCHYFDMRRGRDLTPPYDVPALPPLGTDG